MKKLYFPKTPAHLSVVDSKIQNLISNNPYIKRLSEEGDIFARYYYSKERGCSLFLDIVDIKAKKTIAAMRYDTKLQDFSEEKFISEIKQPSIINCGNKGSLLNKIKKLNKAYTEKKQYYNFEFYTIKNIRKAIWDDTGDIPKGLKQIMKWPTIVYNDYLEMNKTAMSEIGNA